MPNERTIGALTAKLQKAREIALFLFRNKEEKMKLLNFGIFKIEYGIIKKIYSGSYYVQFGYSLKFNILWQISYCLRLISYSNWKVNYRYDFINQFKLLKKDIEDETA